MRGLVVGVAMITRVVVLAQVLLKQLYQQLYQQYGIDRRTVPVVF